MDKEALKQAEHAQRQANRAAKRGDLAAAERWSKTAERLAAAANAIATAREAEAEEIRLTQEEREQFICEFFGKAAFIAHAMVHAPVQAPAAYQGLIKLWREHNLGEGEADAERAAALMAESKAAYFEDRFPDSLPDFVRESLDVDWRERREEMKDQPVIPKFWE